MDIVAAYNRARGELTEEYLAPVPSQFLHMPRATIRCVARMDDGTLAYSTAGYTRALADDCLAMSGCIDAGRTQ